MIFDTLLLMTQPQQGKEQSPLATWLPLILILVVFYVFMILPQSRRAKKQKTFRESLKKGDKVVTTAGIHGKIVEIDANTMVIELEEKTKMRVDLAAVSMESTQAANGESDKK